MKFDAHIPEIKLEKYLLGELPEKEMEEIRHREEKDDVLRFRLQAMREQNGKILAENPFENLAEKFYAAENAQPAKISGEFFSLFVKVAAAFVLALGIFTAIFTFGKSETLLLQPKNAGSSDVAMAETRIKGMQARMEVWKKTGDSAVQLQANDWAREGDELQLRYLVPEKCFGLLFSMDGNGVLTVHLGNGDKAVALEPGKMTTLPFAYKLDNAPHFEKFFLLTSADAFSVDGSDIDKSLAQPKVQTISFTLLKQEK